VDPEQGLAGSKPEHGSASDREGGDESLLDTAARKIKGHAALADVLDHLHEIDGLAQVQCLHASVDLVRSEFGCLVDDHASG
jgi:hypothetical protein